MLPDSPALMAEIAQQCNLPIATGERFTTIFEYQQLLENRACAYVRPDVCLCGGLTGSKKVAAMAEAHHVKVIPHNPLSPVSTAACVQLDACIPNFALQEYTGESEPPKSELLVGAAGAGRRLPDRPRRAGAGHRAERGGSCEIPLRGQGAGHAHRPRRLRRRPVVLRRERRAHSYWRRMVSS